MISFIKRKRSKFSYSHIPCGICFRFLTLKPYGYFAYSEKYEYQIESIFSTSCDDDNKQNRYVFLVLAEDDEIYYLDIDNVCFKLFENLLFTNAKVLYSDINKQRLFIKLFLKNKIFCMSRISTNNNWPHFYISQITNKKIHIKKNISFINTIDKYVTEELMPIKDSVKLINN